MRSSKVAQATLLTFVLSVATALALLSSSTGLLAQDGTWSTKARMPTDQYAHGVGVVNGIIYSVGGAPDYSDTVQAYDPSSDTWTAKAPMPTGRRGLGAVAVNGLLYAFGGEQNTSTLRVVEVYDPTTDSWASRAPMPTPRTRHAVAVVDGIVYVIGGCTDYGCNGFVSTVEAYDPATDTWTSKASMPTARRDITAGTVQGLIYVAGGAFGPGCVLTSVVEAYNPLTDAWSTKASLGAARNTIATGVVNDTLYAIGGGNCGDGDLGTVEAYKPATDTWSTVTSMPTERALAGAATVNSVLYVIGGAGPGAATANEAFTPNPATQQANFFLHATGSTLFLDGNSPMASTAKFKDSTSIKFAGGNSWKEIGVWNAAPIGTAEILNGLGDLHVWVGVKNSDDIGTRFDLRAEALRNGSVIASGETYCITGVARNENLAKEVVTFFGAFSPTFLAGTDVISLRVLTRIGTTGGAFCGGHSSAVGLRLYFDATSRPSKFDGSFQE